MTLDAQTIALILGTGGVGAILKSWFETKTATWQSKRVDFKELDSRLQEKTSQIETLLTKQINDLSAQVQALMTQTSNQDSLLQEQSRQLAIHAGLVAAQEVEIRHLRERLAQYEQAYGRDHAKGITKHPPKNNVSEEETL